MMSSEVDFRYTTKIYVSKIQTFPIFLLLLKRVNSLKITRGLTCEKPKKYGNFEKSFEMHPFTDSLEIIQSTQIFLEDDQRT